MACPVYGEAMDFIFLTLGAIGLVALCLVLVARAYPGSGADLVDWKPTRSHELEAQLEIDDVQQMIDAQNEYRRRRGAASDREDATEARDARRHGARRATRPPRELEDEYGA